MGLFKSFNKYKENIAIIDKKYSNLSYKQVLTETNEIKKKVKNRSLILIVSENSLGSLLAYIFCIINNHVGIIIDSKTTNQNILKIFKNYQPNYVFLSKKTKSIFDKICSEKYTFFDQSLMKNQINKKKKLNNNLSLLLSTSGSMGSIKFVKLSKSNLKHNTDSIISYLKINSKDSAITNLPISYSYMLSVINTHFEAGASIVISKYSLIQKEFWKILKNSKVTSFNGVPYTYEILTRIGLKNIKIETLKYLTHAGGKLEKDKLKEIIKFCKKNNLKFFSMYGQTEASPRISYVPPERALAKLGSVGMALDIGRFYTDAVDSVSEGELIYEGPNVCMGYAYSREDLSKPDSNKGILRTGDIATIDNEGYATIVGRKKRFVKVYGSSVNLDDLESKLKAKSFDTAVIGRDEKIIVLTTGDDSARIKSYLYSFVNFPTRAIKIIKVDNIKYSGVGKPDYLLMAKEYS